MVTRVSQQIYEQNNGIINYRSWGTLLHNAKVSGATGDGTDETAEIQAAIDAAIAADMKAVFFPNGTYVASSLSNLSSVVIFGDNATLTVGGQPIYVHQLGSYTKLNLYATPIINGNMEVAQAGTSFTVATGTSKYTVDCIKSANTGSGANAVATQMAITDLNGSKFGLQFEHTGSPSAGGKLMHFYTFEAVDSYKLAGQQITVSIKVKGIAGMNRATLYARYKTSESAINESSTLIGNTSAVTISSSSWTTLTLTVTLPSRATLTTTGVIGFQIVASKTTAESLNDGFLIAQWCYGLGSDVPIFQPRTFAEEYALCQRYYEKSYNYATVPGTSTQGAGIEAIYTGTTVGNGGFYGKVKFKTKKRTMPTITIYPYTTASNTGRVSDSGGTDLAASSGSTVFRGDDGFMIYNASGGSVSVPSGVIIFHYEADARL